MTVIRSNQAQKTAALNQSAQTPVAQYLGQYKAIASAANKLGANVVAQKLAALGPAPDAMWSDKAALKQMSGMAHVLSAMLGDAVATQLPPDTAANVLQKNPSARTYYTFKESALMFDIAAAQATGDTATQKQLAAKLVQLFPDNAMVDFYKGMAGTAKGWGPR
jgi:hypothetical protein